MAAPSNEEIKQLEERAQSFIPEAAEQQQPAFLSLAPTTSASYPQAPKSRRKSASQALTAGALAGVAEAVPVPTRRTSSMSSDGSTSKTQTLKFLKLGPVHWGEHPDDHKADWHEAVIEEP